MSSRTWWIGLSALLLAAIAIGLWWARGDTAPDDASVAIRADSPATPPVTPIATAPDDSARFVGSATCSECHAEIAATFREHPMGKSSSAILAAPLEDYVERTSFEPRQGLTMQVEKTSEAVYHHEIRRAGQEQIYDRKVAVNWAIGSGKRGRSYAFESDANLFMSPISWYAQRGWDLSPGYSADRGNLFDRRAIDGCLACHLGRLNPRKGSPNRFEKPMVLEAAISCERCHGGGAEHVARHQSAAPPSGPDPIVNPSRLGPVERESVCNQCHLQGHRRILRAGRTTYDFRPGQRLDETWTVFVRPSRAAGEKGAVKAVSQVEQMQSSTCFRKSAGAMGCISCHNPHVAVAEDEKATYYEERCQKCHERKPCLLPLEERRRSEKGSSCIDCHMPRLPASDVPHTSQTDHRVLRVPQPIPAEPPSGEEEQLQIFDVATSKVPDLDLMRARTLLAAMDVERTRDPVRAAECLRDLLALDAAMPGDPEIVSCIGAVSLALGNSQEAEASWLRALELRPEDDRLLQQLSLFYVWSRRPEARQYLEKALALNSWNSEAWGRYAQVLAQSGDWLAAVTAAEKGLEVDPSLVPLRTWLVGAYWHLNDDTAAKRHQHVIDQLKASR